MNSGCVSWIKKPMFTNASIDHRINHLQSFLFTTFGFILTLFWLIINILDSFSDLPLRLALSACLSAYSTWLGEYMHAYLSSKAVWHAVILCSSLSARTGSVFSSLTDLYLISQTSICLQMEWEKSSIPHLSAWKNLSLMVVSLQ